MIKKKNASAIVYLIFFFVVFLAFCSFAVDGTIVFTERMKLQNMTEATALATASSFNSFSEDGEETQEQEVKIEANDIFNELKKGGLPYAQLTNIEVNITGKKVLIETESLSRPFFLAFLGVSGIKLEAKACAQSEKLNVKSNYGGINWISASAAYLSDIISKTINYYDTAILPPLGKLELASIDPSSGFVKFDLIDSDDSQPLSLGPGGFVTIKLPDPIVDKPGPDLHITEYGAAEGYFVFAGIDNNPDKPYVQHSDDSSSTTGAGDGISWVNISCTGTSDVSNALLVAYTAQTIGLDSQTKFYGSGSFDIGATCSTPDGFKGISMAKYIRIIDDNEESAIIKNNIGDSSDYYKTLPYGEASTATAGADIDSVEVLNHVVLIKSSEF